MVFFIIEKRGISVDKLTQQQLKFCALDVPFIDLLD